MVVVRPPLGATWVGGGPAVVVRPPLGAMWVWGALVVVVRPLLGTTGVRRALAVGGRPPLRAPWPVATRQPVHEAHGGGCGARSGMWEVGGWWESWTRRS